MTVSTTFARQYFNGDNSNLVFPFNIKFFINSQIYVTKIMSDLSLVPLTENVDYTLAGAGVDAGGTVTMAAAPLVGQRLLVQRILPYTQSTSIRNQGSFNPSIHEDEFDYLTMLAQQASDDTGRSLKLNASGTAWDAQAKTITNLADPVLPSDAVTKGFLASVSGLIQNAVSVLYDATNLFDFLRFSNVRAVDTVADLRNLVGTRNQRAQTLGYYAKGDAGGNFFYLDTADTTTADNGGTVIVGADGSRWKAFNKQVITTKQFGCKADGTTNDFAAISKWFTFGINNLCEMVISNGVHKVNSALSWDFTPVATVGITMRGESSLVNCRIDLSAVTGSAPMTFFAAGATALFYIRLRDFGITTNYNGQGVTVGKTDFTDAWNECSFDLWINNNSQGASAVTCCLNHVLHSQIRLVCNGGGSGRPSQPLAPGYGTALILRQCIMSNLMLALGNANKGLYITGGYTYKNIFHAMDIEEINYGVLIDVATATQNNFLGGTYLALNVLNASAGLQNLFLNCGFQAYAGGTLKVSTVGCTIVSPQQYDVATPAIPASGVAVVNAQARAVMVSVAAGTVGAITIAQAGGLGNVGIPIGTWNRADIHLLPGETITLTYSAAPAWIWRPIA